MAGENQQDTQRKPANKYTGITLDERGKLGLSRFKTINLDDNIISIHIKDNYGKLVPTKNPYPVWLNEQGSLFVIPALENVSTEMVVSGQLDFIQYVFRGANYK